ncbi:2,3-diaminopropionate biosynthesis protein SbnB [Streptomyces pluripotens]|uniref:2,3-diaminopropionate biosynthesis protein SbnB n=1 Tax=Streptomyces pluripotens TaxID=1355015 RepID=A0A221P744_9ACTN|nr:MULTISPECIES: 2,3-diaminopropionate biosynthesis protein SbnB [Streptomyces]ARP73355.1 2,3-diaminopropionate biosynthesis protein SbnB [Streptomyces pluripotens]ASN27605.1 2,3-diaminopropionate biosynthesis protein SbnB [Streptomyces pluripotens]KIE28527.1 ornithine cyclodeaminase [Streptomyces sp. MUSC 125]MCH0560281.1 2,3-diaminopropionate biosynthesis protein SbnB [Streptomyces sp. MUM 16J]
MSSQAGTPPFSVVPGSTVHQVLDGRQREIIELVEQAYRLHGEGHTVNPPSYFLRFPDRPTARIIALPASVGGDAPVDGLKWISSFPGNLDRGIPRASAVLILNDPATGYPYACLESSIISAVRTAASAAVAARALGENRPVPHRVGYLGTGLIARYVHSYLSALGLPPQEYAVHDVSGDYARSFAGHLARNTGTSPLVLDSAEELVRSCDLIVCATTAATPHLLDPSLFSHHPLVLHVSLRDLGTEVVLGSFNVVDDVEHVLKANTSVHLAEQRTGGRDFLDGTLYDVLTGTLKVPADRTVVFSPFGLGVLDLAVGAHVHARAGDTGRLVTVDGFFHDLDRHDSPETEGGRR